jgi:di/tricarboxylate transporter
VGGLVLLLVAGVLPLEAALSGFANQGLVAVGALYVVATGLQQTGLLAWVSRHVLGMPRTLDRAMVRLIVPVIASSAFLNNTPVVAMFLPAVRDWARKLGFSPSKLMIPLSYAAILGGMCTLIGTSTNVVLNGLYIAETGSPGLGMFTIAPVGLACALAGALILVFLGKRLLPDRVPPVSEADDARRYTVEMLVQPACPFVGRSIQEAGLRHLPGLFLMEIHRQDQIVPAVGPQERLAANDRLVFVGVVDSIVDLQRFPGLIPAPNQIFKLDAPRSQRCLIEAVVSDSCPIVGRNIREGQFRKRYNAVVVAVARNGERLHGKIGDIVLRPGDTLVIEAHPSFVDRQRLSSDFYLVSQVPESEPLRRNKAPLALLVLAGLVAATAAGHVPMVVAALAAAMLMVVTGCCSPDQARRSINWQVLVIIGAALGIGRALTVTGAAHAIAEAILTASSGNPWLALVGVYAVTMIFTEIITNNAAVGLSFPIAFSLANSLHVDMTPFLIAIMIAGSASFLTPIGYQTNLIVYGPGGYRFTDFTRMGLPISLACFAITVLLTPLIYPF